MRTNANALNDDHTAGLDPVFPYCLASQDHAEDGPRSPAGSDRTRTDHEALPYRVELWDETKTTVEQVLAVTVNGSIGYAAYYAATRDYPLRYVTLRHKGGIVSRWNGPSQ
jgi:hypothetical protein